MVETVSEAIKTLLLAAAGLVVIGVGVGLLLKANKAKNKEVAQTGVNVVMGIVVVAAGVGLGLVAFGSDILAAFGISS